MKEITKTQWQNYLRNEYGFIINKQKYILTYSEEGTTLIPVIVK